jgi:regulator of protease activity HflC (stomatin/prohibitin superfamily)
MMLLSCLSGIFFVLPCIESYQKVDLRTITLGVPPQEVSEKEGWWLQPLIDQLSKSVVVYK